MLLITSLDNCILILRGSIIHLLAMITMQNHQEFEMNSECDQSNVTLYCRYVYYAVMLKHL